MWNLAILALLTIYAYLYLKMVSDRNFLKIQAGSEKVRYEYGVLVLANESLDKENKELEGSLEGTIALYNITKDICKSLDEGKVFDNFFTQLKKYIEINDCKFLKSEADAVQYPGYDILPLDNVGYLAISRIREEDREKLAILAQQFLLGLKRAILYHKVQELAITDSLTKLFSRRYLLERLSEEVERAKKFNYNFSFLMLDIDHFKDYNDRYGHLVGDAILREVAYILKENTRQIDLAGRYGGEEFSAILTETDKNQAGYVAERIRLAIEQKVINAYDEHLKVTISIGIAVFPENASSSSDLVDKADKALYHSKQAGRNRVSFYSSR